MVDGKYPATQKRCSDSVAASQVIQQKSRVSSVSPEENFKEPQEIQDSLPAQPGVHRYFIAIRCPNPGI
jgi:hypothetical protein